MIKVCDAIMGSGKSSAAITYINEHKDLKFIYITPYLNEAERIVNACSELEFVQPSNKYAEFGHQKYQHTLSLINEGKNIATTHAMFLRYSETMIEAIKKNGYTLIIDESVNVIQDMDVPEVFISLLKDAGWITQTDTDIYNLSLPSSITSDRERFGKGHCGFDIIDRISHLAESKRIVGIQDGDGKVFYCIYSKKILDAFKDVFILTYLFEASSMKYYFDIENISYQTIGISKTDGIYRFSDTEMYIPPYTESLSSMIHIFDNDKLNDIGKPKTALSFSWLSNKSSEYKAKQNQLRRNTSNYFKNYFKGVASEDKLWSTYKSGREKVVSNGYASRFLSYNCRATNEYRNCYVLAYCVNIFMRPCEKNFYLSRGVDVHEDEAALSTMIQWIWRSAIRDGKEIWIYIPSRRMRELLTDWISSVEQRYKDYKENQHNDKNE